MGAGKSNRQLRIKLLLAIDTTFFFLELITGIAIGSIALLADSFHMLNDVISLIVALKAIDLATQETSSSKYTYGWQRAEVLGALVNGVFLLALCFSIGLEAIARLFADVEITNPKMMVIVGSAGLVSNIVGLFLFHDHGHSHGGHSHSHSHSRSHSHNHEHTPLLEAPEEANSEAPKSSDDANCSRIIQEAEQEEAEAEQEAEEELFVHPGEFRDNIRKAARGAGYGSCEGGNIKQKGRQQEEQKDHHVGHSHGDHGHGGEGSMNMRGVFLHVLGDALGNVGVIIAGLFIWLTDYSWKDYSDPIVSIIITCIIFNSALPLVKSASFILLQGVPAGVPLDVVRAQIINVPGVVGVHELHIWALSESKTVCSVHVNTSPDADFVDVCRDIRVILHRFGVHSSTIQPEVLPTSSPLLGGSRQPSRAESIVSGLEDGCTMGNCVGESCVSKSCCAPVASRDERSNDSHA